MKLTNYGICIVTTLVCVGVLQYTAALPPHQNSQVEKAAVEAVSSTVATIEAGDSQISGVNGVLHLIDMKEIERETNTDEDCEREYLVQGILSLKHSPRIEQEENEEHGLTKALEEPAENASFQRTLYLVQLNNALLKKEGIEVVSKWTNIGLNKAKIAAALEALTTQAPMAG